MSILTLTNILSEVHAVVADTMNVRLDRDNTDLTYVRVNTGDIELNEAFTIGKKILGIVTKHADVQDKVTLVIDYEDLYGAPKYCSANITPGMSYDDFVSRMVW